MDQDKTMMEPHGRLIRGIDPVLKPKLGVVEEFATKKQLMLQYGLTTNGRLFAYNVTKSLAWPAWFQRRGQQKLAQTH